MSDALQSILEYVMQMQGLEFMGLVFGLMAVIFLIKENIWTWPAGIIYCIISFFIFWEARLYGDFILHIYFFVLNIYGWYVWIAKRNQAESKVFQVTSLNIREQFIWLGVTVSSVFLFAQMLIALPRIFPLMEPASLPYWDSITSMLSITGMWLTTRKKIDNWYYWLIVDIIATGVYWYKGYYFYSLLYFIYIFFAVAGYIAWRKSLVQAN